MKRGFYIISKSWYADSALKGQRYVDEIMFGMYADEGGTDGEMCIRWYDLGNGQICPRLEVFDDSWEVLASFTDVIQAMAEVDGLNLSVDDFAVLLVDCGFEDHTQTNPPYKRQQEMNRNAEVERFKAFMKEVEPTSTFAKIYSDTMKRLEKV